MKTSTLLTIIIILLLAIQMSPQINNRLELWPDAPMPERITPYSIQDEKTGHLLKSDFFNDKKSRAIINKIILENGILYERIELSWVCSNWVNDKRWTYAYDVNDNMVEELRQNWDGFNWVNYLKTSSTYDVANNVTEQLYQVSWDSSTWVNLALNTYTYDLNNNLIRELAQDWNVSNWVNYWNTTFDYDENNNMIQRLR